MARRKFLSLHVVLVVALSACLTGNDAASPESQDPAVTVHVPLLSQGASAAFNFSGTPSGIYHGFSRVGQDEQPLPEAGTLTVATEPVLIVDPRGLSSQATKFSYRLRASEAPLEAEYASDSGGLLARQIKTIYTSEGRSEEVMGADWRGGRPDLLNALLWSGREMGDDFQVRFPMPEGSPLVRDGLDQAAWEVSPEAGFATVELATQDILSWRGWSAYHVQLDETCPFPRQVRIEKDGGTIFEAQRTSCEQGGGASLGLSGTDDRIVEPNPHMAEAGEATALTDWNPSGDWSLHQAWRLLKEDDAYAACSGCRLVAIHWGMGNRTTAPTLPIHEPETRNVRQWVFDFHQDGSSVSFAAERTAPDSEVRRIEHDVEGGGTAGIFLDGGALDGLHAMVDPGALHFSMYRQPLSGAASPANALLILDKGERLLGENNSTVAGFPLYIFPEDEGRLGSWALARTIEVA